MANNQPPAANRVPKSSNVVNAPQSLLKPSANKISIPIYIETSSCNSKELTIVTNPIIIGKQPSISTDQCVENATTCNSAATKNCEIKLVYSSETKQNKSDFIQHTFKVKSTEELNITEKKSHQPHEKILVLDPCKDSNIISECKISIIPQYQKENSKTNEQEATVIDCTQEDMLPLVLESYNNKPAQNLVAKQIVNFDIEKTNQKEDVPKCSNEKASVSGHRVVERPNDAGTNNVDFGQYMEFVKNQHKRYKKLDEQRQREYRQACMILMNDLFDSPP